MAWLFAELPGVVRLLIAEILFVGITCLVVWRFHARIVALSAGEPWPPADHEDEDEDEEKEKEKEKRNKKDGPEPFNLAGRIMAITMTAFVFLLAFTLNNFWGNAQDARVAVEEEGADYQSLLIAAHGLPDGPFKDDLQKALENYGQSVITQEWPLLEQADSAEALIVHRRLGRELAAVTILQEPPADVAKSPAWPSISTTVTNMLEQGTQRIHQLPRPQAPNVIALIFLLAIINLAVTAAYQPARPVSQNVFLMGLMAGIVALMLFILVEASNPFTGAGALLPTSYGL